MTSAISFFAVAQEPNIEDAEFATDLRRRGIEAWALAEDYQLELKLG